MGERERGLDCFEDFGFGPVPAVETGFESAADAECLIFFEGGGLTSLETSAPRMRPSLPERGPTELSRLLRSITSLRAAEMAELWLERDVGGISEGDVGRASLSSMTTSSSGMMSLRDSEWRGGTRRGRCWVGGYLKRNVSHLP